MAPRIRPRRTRSLRFTLAGLLVVPLVSLLALWAFAANVTLRNALQDRAYNQILTQSGPASNALAAQLSQERLATYIWLTSGRQGPVGQLAAARSATSKAVAAYRRVVAKTSALTPAATRRAQDRLLSDLDLLPNIRDAIDSGALTPANAFVAYSNIIDAQFATYGASEVNDLQLYRQTFASVETARAAEMIGREAALVAGAAVAGGRMSAPERRLFAAAVDNQRLLVNDALTQLNQPLRGMWAALYASPAHRRFAALEDRIASSVAARGPIPVSIQTWQADTQTFTSQLQVVLGKESPPLAHLAAQISDQFLVQASLAAGVGLVAVLASILLMLRFGRRLTGDLTRLHDSAESMASERLPRVVERLRRGEDVDVAAESPPPAPGRITEVADLAKAFSAVQRTAVEAAVGQANLRKGVNRVFLNLSLRSQSLLHRQLSMLDAMERDASDPKTLADLFRVDHLTTRMRRHAEGLIILSGATPGRGWRDPVPVIDVLRAAVAEVEEYVRVDVVSESREAIIGAAVNDVIHLIAELIENATTFSPPSTQVEVRADSAGAGFVVEIEDRGLGLTEPEMTQINHRLASPPEFDLVNSEQLGLFVVGQLAARHRIAVTLNGSPYGGTRAVVHLPAHLVAQREELTGRALPRGQAAPAAPAGTPAVTMTSAALTLTAEPLPSPSLASPSLALGPALPGTPGAGAVASGPQEPLGPQEPPGAQDARGPSGVEETPGAPAPPRQSQAFDVWAPAPRQPPAPGRHARPQAQSGGQQVTPAGAGAGAGQPTPATTHMGLPVRVRQASLAPQLRTRPEADPGPDPAAPDSAAVRSPEHTRSLMSALQAGWQQGRTDDLDNPAGGPGQAADPHDGKATR